jgi:putative transposase
MTMPTNDLPRARPASILGRMPNYRRRYLPGHPVFVTLVTHMRRPWMAEEHRRAQVLAAMRTLRSRHAFRHWAHVLLPDHLHWLFTPADGNFSLVVAALKRSVTWSLRDVEPIRLWQARFYDHVIRDAGDLQRHVDYIHFNPVRHGWAQSPGAWAASSFAVWQARGQYPEDWGLDEPRGIEGMALD